MTGMGPGPGPGQCPVAWCVPEDARILRDSEQYSQHYGDVLPHHIVCSVTLHTSASLIQDTQVITSICDLSLVNNELIKGTIICD